MTNQIPIRLTYREMLWRLRRANKMYKKAARAQRKLMKGTPYPSTYRSFFAKYNTEAEECFREFKQEYDRRK